MSKDRCAFLAFVKAGSRGKSIEAWSLYDVDILGDEETDDGCIIGDEDILASWDIEGEEEAGKIPAQQYDVLIEKLKLVIKGKKKQ